MGIYFDAGRLADGLAYYPLPGCSARVYFFGQLRRVAHQSPDNGRLLSVFIADHQGAVLSTGDFRLGIKRINFRV